MMPFAPHTRYYLGFNLVRGVGPIRLQHLLERCGSIEAAWHASTADLHTAGLDRKTAASLVATREATDLDALLKQIARQQIDLVTLADDHYPRLLREIPAAPPLLYLRGALEPVDEWSIAVVGTRSPTSYGKEVTRQIVGELARRGIVIVSGLATGVDTVAHTAALEAGGRTIAVLGNGVNTIYPERNHNLGLQISEAGALISDYPLGTKPHAANFPPRNRIISGLSLGVLVIEAREQSGALITVDFAAEQGRDVFAVPGSIFNSTSRGPHNLIRNGAGLVSSADDLLEALNMQMAQAHQQVAVELLLEDPTEAAVMGQLSGEPQHIDSISRACDLPANIVAATLTVLELKGFVRPLGNMEYVRARL